MRRLAVKQVQALHDEMTAAAQNGREAFERWLDEHDRPAILEFPGGELFCSGIRGFLWAWRLKNALSVGRLQKGDRFDANGLEGKISVETTLATALLAWANLPRHRRQVRT